ncbi:MAG: class I SAM-dependent methyltransferase [Thermodesulfobacteriota bacterium]
MGILRRRLRARFLALPWNGKRAKRLVGEGYDAMAPAYAQWSLSCGGNRRRGRWAAALAGSLPRGSAVLDLGCGPGAEAALWAQRGLEVTGVDLSAENVRLARERVAGGRFLRGDMAELDFPAGSFDAVAAFYSLIHLPRREQPGMMARIHGWLRPGGLFLANLASRPFGGLYDPGWLGVPMYWSSLGSQGAQGALRGAGFSVLRADHAAETDFGRRHTFLWFVAQREPDGSADFPGARAEAARLLAALEQPGDEGAAP